MKIEKGVMIMKDGKAWGKEYEDSHSTSYGWIIPENAPIHDPDFCKATTDATYAGSPYIDELKTGKLISVTRKTEVIINE